jgi:hypothetical protein
MELTSVCGGCGLQGGGCVILCVGCMSSVRKRGHDGACVMRGGRRADLLVCILRHAAELA